MPNTNILLPSKIDLEKFISDQAHDLRTPFNHITGFSKMLLNTLSVPPLTDIQREDLGTVYRSSMHALTLLNGLIDIARINQHEKELSLKETDIEQLLVQGLALWKKFHPGTEIQPEYQVQTTLKTICADELMIRQVISSVTAFVAQYCEPAEKVIISVTEQPDCFLFNFTAKGPKARQPSELDRELFGCINRTLIELHGGEIRQAEETDDGAVLQFSLLIK